MYVVYIHEAHAADSWQLPVNVRDNVIFATPRTYEERQTVADACVRKLGIEIPALIDDAQDTTERAYTGWPDRIYVIDREGKVAFKTGPGPWGFQVKPAEAALKRVVGEGTQSRAGVSRAGAE